MKLPDTLKQDLQDAFFEPVKPAGCLNRIRALCPKNGDGRPFLFDLIFEAGRAEGIEGQTSDPIQRESASEAASINMEYQQQLLAEVDRLSSNRKVYDVFSKIASKSRLEFVHTCQTQWRIKPFTEPAYELALAVKDMLNDIEKKTG